MTALAQPVHHLQTNDFSAYPLLRLFDEARLLIQQESALQYRLAAVLRELDARDHFDGKPVRLARWLHDNFGLTFGAAREKVRTARALGNLPLIDGAFRDGAVSFSKVRALTRVATPDNEADLLERARTLSADAVEQLVRRVKHNDCLDDVQVMIRSRALSTRWDETGMLVVQGKLTPEQGEVFLQALTKAMAVLPDSSARENATDSDKNNAGDNAEEETYWARRSDALTHIMADSLSGKTAHTPGDRHQLMVHVSAETLAGGDSEEAVELDPVEPTEATTPGAKNVTAETPFHPETLRRLACDGGLITVIEDARRNPLSIGRKSRVIPPAMRRALLARDRHCQYPGCGQEQYVEGHHMVHWAHGGATRLDNLVLLCGHHHRQVHEFGERIQRAEDGRVRVLKTPELKTVCTGAQHKTPVQTGSSGRQKSSISRKRSMPRS